VSTTDYIVDILLIVVILRQLRPSEVSLKTAIVPIAIMVWAGFHYLHGFKVGGNDVLLMVVLTVSGIALGTLSGFTTQVWDHSGHVLARVGAAAIVFWVIGMGFRFAFAVYASSSSGDAAIGRFSAHHAITSAQAWTTALVLMAFGEVVARVCIMQYRRMQLRTPQVALA
jgi:hypothetical protein